MIKLPLPIRSGEMRGKSHGRQRKVLHHDTDLLPEFEPAHRAHLLHGHGRRYGAVQAAAGVRRHVPDGHRRARTEDPDPGRREGRHASGLRRRSGRRDQGPLEDHGDLLRRLHPDHGAAAREAGPGAVHEDVREGRHLQGRVRRMVLHALRVLLDAEPAGGRKVLPRLWP